MRGTAVNEDDSRGKKNGEHVFRNQMLNVSFADAMRSARSPIPTDQKFLDLLQRLDKAEKDHS